MAAIAALAVVSCVKDERDPNALIPEEKPEAPVTLLINELDPNNKKLEFFNNGTEEISLKGCYMIKDGTDRWEFPDVKVAPKGIIVYTANSTDPNEGPEFGMSPTKGFKMELFDKNDKALDIVDNLKSRGFRFVTVSRLAVLRGTVLRPGKTYSSFPPRDGAK